MAVIVSCDGGCGALQEDETFEERGYIDKRMYCKKCVEAVDAHLSERDALHGKLIRAWNADIEKLKGAFKKKHPKAVLPDD